MLRLENKFQYRNILKNETIQPMQNHFLLVLGSDLPETVSKNLKRSRWKPTQKICGCLAWSLFAACHILSNVSWIFFSSNTSSRMKNGFFFLNSIYSFWSTLTRNGPWSTFSLSSLHIPTIPSTHTSTSNDGSLLWRPLHHITTNVSLVVSKDCL